MTSYALFGAIEQGFAYGLMVIGVYLTFRVLDFPDLTVDGSLPLGAAVSAVAITSGYSPVLAILLAACAGFIAGSITGILNTKFKILHLLSSILTMIALYSINLRIMGRPNMTLLGQDTIVDWFIETTGLLPHLSTPALFFIICACAVTLLIWFLHTEQGLIFLATGDNKQMITSQGVNTDNVIIFGVGLSNALVAISGALVAQNQGAADVNMGVGTIIAGLASVIIGETIFGDKTISRALIAALLGSVLYRIAIALALGLKLGDFAITPSDLNLITALLVIIALVMPRVKQKFMARS
ncbi:ABC transporter permease [Pseudodesulfovibrio piezophilus]|uniref:Inner-membrane translocator n=1 Tax=Pseudodesulfovibrio piezophilus (strain DSM 21447 / JCM 15486 / C1TLV30) TaxID=1322246 RepID=M1WUQ6_PSEP2|nr:ABC transporter permease [Pseudodesulfovibrio piezophilus]CCH47753.1 Inner-membrane translocator [Pseudodesulfovibrio piezophilus C1TLV30]